MNLISVPTPLTDARIITIPTPRDGPEFYVSPDFARRMERLLQLWGILHNTPPLITDEKEWQERYAELIKLAVEFLSPETKTK